MKLLGLFKHKDEGVTSTDMHPYVWHFKIVRLVNIWKLLIFKLDIEVSDKTVDTSVRKACELRNVTLKV